MKRRKVEIIVTKNEKPSPNLKTACIVCGKKLEADRHGGADAQIFPCIYGGVVFRSTGQFGSTVLDCGFGIPSGWEPFVQIIVCDVCLVKKARTVNTARNKRTVIERRHSADVPVERSDYATFAELRKAERECAKANKAKIKSSGLRKAVINPFGNSWTVS